MEPLYFHTMRAHFHLPCGTAAYRAVVAVVEAVVVNEKEAVEDDARAFG
jgi:hypothetical protein